MVNKLLNFRCPEELLTAIEAYGRENYPAAPSKRGSIDYDQSKAIRDILVAGLDVLTNGEVKLDRDEIVKQPQQKSDICIDLEQITAQISSQFEDRFKNLEEALAGK